jgi:hypothetical protein
LSGACAEHWESTGAAESAHTPITILETRNAIAHFLQSVPIPAAPSGAPDAR